MATIKRDFYEVLEVEKTASGPSWRNANWPPSPKSDLISALDGDWGATEKVVGEKIKAKSVAILPGSDPSAKAILLLAHIDVVEAKREDWVRDPFTLIEENGKFYARGTVDDVFSAEPEALLKRARARARRPDRRGPAGLPRPLDDL